MKPAMSIHTQRACIWAGPAFVVLFFIGFGGLAGWVPPASPGDSAAQIARMYRDNHDMIRLGLIITSMCSALLLPFFAAISAQMSRIEGRYRVLTYLQLAAGALACLEFIFPVMIWQAAAFRVDRSDDEIRLLNDLGWLPFLGIVSTAIIQGIAIGVAILQDRRERPIFPRWSGYFNIWVISLLAPGGIIVFFQSGPFAWNGLLAWWLVLAAYFSWIMVNTALLLRAVNRQGVDQCGDDTADPGHADEHTAREIEELRRRLDALESTRGEPAADRG